MKTEYNGIDISYVEDSNDWHFELRGRSRKADSLAKAKEAIDKEPKEKRSQTFPRFQAYFKNYSKWQTVTVTSVAEDGYYSGGKAFWIIGEDGRKKKERDSTLYPVNDHNTSIYQAILVKEKEIESLEEQKAALFGRLQTAAVPEEIA